MADSIHVMTAAVAGSDDESVLSSAHFSRNSLGDNFSFTPDPFFLSSLVKVVELSNVFDA